MSECPTCEICQRLEAEVFYLQRIDFWACMEKSQELLRHKMDAHIPPVVRDEPPKQSPRI